MNNIILNKNKTSTIASSQQYATVKNFGHNRSRCTM